MGQLILAICAAAILSGCASRPMTPEQRQFAAEYFLSQQERYKPPAPYYMPMPAQSPAPRNCMSNVIGNTIYTNCY